MVPGSPDNYYVSETFNNEKELVRFLYTNFDADRRRYFFDGIVDTTGSETEKDYYYERSADGHFRKRVETQHRKPWLFAEEITSDWLEVINPYSYQRDVNRLVELYGGKKQSPTFRQEPVPRTGKRIRYMRSIAEKPVKHTAWYREEKARQTMDKEWDQHHYRLPIPHYEDYNFYHKHSEREYRTWKNKKIRRQWMKRSS